MVYYIFSVILIISTFIPLLPYQHWFFRVFDFGKVQIMVLQIVLLVIGFLTIEYSNLFFILQSLMIVCVFYELSLLYKYSPFFPITQKNRTEGSSEYISILSANIYQYNRCYDRFMQLVKSADPDIVITMESDNGWEEALQELKKEYPYFVEKALDNTYGMHLYSKIEIKYQKIHYFIADDIPSIEAHIETKDGFNMIVYAVHPPPPSPTEEKTSKERDGELMSVAKSVEKQSKTTMVIGDFNNVAWARSSVLFRKISKLIDPRIGRGLISTFHAKYWFLRFPIDQMFHSSDIFVQTLRTEPYFGSDHLALYCRFFIDKMDRTQEKYEEDICVDEHAEVNQMIVNGKKEQSDR